jgi:hypothetical protein
MTRMTRGWLAAAAVMGLAACNSATGSDSGRARMQVAATGDSNSPSAQAAPSGQQQAPRFTTTTADGTITFRARVYAETSSGGWVELTNGAAQQATVDAAGRQGAAVFASSSVDAGAYTHVRVVFEDVHGTLNSGIQVSGGMLSGNVFVAAQGGGSITVERQVNATVSGGGTTTLLLDLNSSDWMGYASAQTHAVSEAYFASAVRIVAE